MASSTVLSVDDLSRQYDQMADAYGDGGPYNALYERPAILQLLGNVEGVRILDAGCGSGVLADGLVGSGARLIGVDSSERMLRLARARLGTRATLRHHDLHQRMDWLDDGSIDLVVSSL